MIRSRVLAVLLVVALPRVAAAQSNKAAAVAAYDEAKRLMGEGKIAEACPKFAASYDADPQLGTLLNLADCHEKLGLLATAWGEYSEVAETARKRGDNREDYARTHAEALAPRLSHLTVRRPAEPIAGLVVRHGGVDITGLLDTALPVDPGSHAVTAEAPGREPWEMTVVIEGEQDAEEISVPALAAVTKKPDEPDDRGSRVVVDSSRRTTRRIIALASAGVGLVSTGVGLYFGSQAFSDWDASRDPALCDADNVCTSQGQALIDSADSAALKADIFVGLGLVGLAAGAVLWFTAPDVETRTEGVSFAPVVSGDAIAGVLRGSF